MDWSLSPRQGFGSESAFGVAEFDSLVRVEIGCLHRRHALPASGLPESAVFDQREHAVPSLFDLAIRAVGPYTMAFASMCS
jgi:hypothetical protein